MSVLFATATPMDTAAAIAMNSPPTAITVRAELVGDVVELGGSDIGIAFSSSSDGSEKAVGMHSNEVHPKRVPDGQKPGNVTA